jgi:hypothetical protein
LIDLLSPSIQEVIMVLQGYSSWWLLDGHSGSPPLSPIASGKHPSPFPTVWL